MSRAEGSQRPRTPAALSYEEWVASSPETRAAAEATWLGLITHGDDGCDLWAFEQLYRAHFESARAVARYWLSEAEAQDAVQSVFCNLWVSRRRLLVRTSVRAYLHHAVRNHVLDRYRRDSAAKKAFDSLGSLTGDDTAPLLGAPGPDPSEYVDRIDLEVACRRAISALSTQTQLLVTLFFHYNMPLREIAFILSVSPEAVRLELHKAQRSLQALLYPMGANAGWPDHR